MSDEIKQDNQLIDPSVVKNELAVKQEDLSKQALTIINNIIDEKDPSKTDALVAVFNDNQKKKTIVRVNKLNDLLDTITDQTIDRFSKRPDEISNQEILQALKIVQDITERSQKQINDANNEKPLIQVNQQTNEINLGGTDGLSKASRDRVKQAVAAILAGIPASNFTVNNNENIADIQEADVINGEIVDDQTSTDGVNNND